MSIKEIEKANTTKAHATRVSVYTIHKYIEQLSSKPTTTSIMDDKYENAHIQDVAIEFSRKRKCEPLRLFFRLKVCAYKKTRQSNQLVIYNSVSSVWRQVAWKIKCTGELLLSSPKEAWAEDCEQAIIVVSVNCNRGIKVVRTIKGLTETKRVFVFT